MLPLRWKLVLLHGVVLTTVIIGLCVLLVVRLRSTWIAGMDEELETRARSLAALLERDEDAWVIERNTVLGDGTDAATAYFVVHDAQGGRLIASPLVSELALPEDIEHGVRVRRTPRGDFRELTLAVTRSIDEEDPDLRGATLLVTCGQDLAPVEANLSTLERQMLIFGPLVLLVALGTGLFLAGRALAPIERIARTAEEIGTSALEKRIDVRGRDELARLAATLNASFDRLQATIERQTRFTADASHELRTPLTIIACQLELALRARGTPEEHRAAFEEIAIATGRMRGIVEGLLTLARADEGAFSLKRSAIDLVELGAGQVRSHAQLAEAEGVTLALDAPRECRLVADRALLEELVSNLLSNAIRYNRRDGSVRLGIARDRDVVTIAVEDTGPGIAPCHLEHLGERFYRVDEARTRERGGSGLGLAIVRWIAEAHGGDLKIESELGRGSRFEVRLPAAEA